jgi:hypothetical protein
VAEISPARVLLRIPVIGELDGAVLLPRGGDEDESKSPGFVIDATNLFEP